MLLKFIEALLLLLASVSRKFKKDLIQTLLRLRRMLSVETKESKKMLQIYRLMLDSKATKEDIAWANNQMKDVLKTLGIGVVLILPFAPLTFPIIVSVSRKLGINIFPDSFEDEDQR